MSIVNAAMAMGAGAAAAINAGIYFGTPVAIALCYGMSKTPPIRMFGTEDSVYGIDWGSLDCKAGNVYGTQLSMWGGGVTGSLYGLQCGILASGYVTSNKLDRCTVDGVQFGTLAAKSATVNGMQISGCVCNASGVNGVQFAGIVCFADEVSGVQCAGFMSKTQFLCGIAASILCLGDDVRGCQFGIVNKAKRMAGVQVGVYNEVSAGKCLQIGAVNCVPTAKLEYLPIFNIRFD